MCSRSSAILNKKGFTLSETLASLLILAMVIVIIGGGVIVVKDAYQRITLKANALTLMSTAVTKASDDFRFAESIDKTGADANGDVNTAAFVDADTSYKMTLTNDNSKGIMQNYVYGNNSEQTQLLTDKTMTDGLLPSISYKYNINDKIFTATITVTNEKITVAEQKIVIRPLNN